MSEAAAVPVADGVLEVESFGAGEPVIVIQTALAVDELRPLAEAVARTPGLRVFHCHRRGYDASSPAVPGASMTDLAVDIEALIDRLGAAPAHVVGVSFSSAIALTLAARAPLQVRTLTVIEPPPSHGPGAAQFRAANAGLVARSEADGPLAALDDFMTTLSGPDWRDRCEADRPGSVAAMERDAATFFGSDLPALLTWTFEGAHAGGIRCPVLLVGGEASGPWFAQARSELRGWLPNAEEVTVTGAGHLVATTHTTRVAAAVTGFVHRRGGGSAGQSSRSASSSVRRRSARTGPER